MGVVLLREVNVRMADLGNALDPDLDPRAHRDRVISSTTRHDMARHPDEGYYARQYWSWIEEHLRRLPGSGHHLDAGCGQGRLTLRLAEWCAAGGGRAIGVDLSAPAIEQASRYALEARQPNVEYLVDDAAAYMARCEDGSFETVLLTEVIFFHPDPPGLLRAARRVLKPGGLLFASFRPQYFHALLTVRFGMWAHVDTISQKRGGRLFGGEAWQSWHTSEEARRLLQADCGLEVLNMVGIGACSGIPGDPHAQLARPSTLSRLDQERLMTLERAVASSAPDAGRYMLAVARRPV
jgi:SAM-dependent methyltransferase